MEINMRYSTLAVSLSVALSALILPGTISANQNSISLQSNTQQSALPSQYQALRSRWAQSFLGDPNIAFDATLQKMVQDTNNGAKKQWSELISDTARTSLWPDLILDDQTDAGKNILGVNIRSSYQRLFTMAKAYRLRDGELQGNSELLTAIIDGMAFLNQHYYRVGAKEWGNWWQWELGTPKDIHNILVLLYEKLPAELILSHTQATRYFTPEATHLGAGAGADVSSNPAYRLSTGGNRTDNTLVVILRGIIDNNSLEIDAAINALSPVLEEVTSLDGFYADGSFLQHYDIAYNGTYGNVLLNGLGAQLNLVAGSDWQANDPILQNIYPIIFKSYAPLLYRGTMMEFVNGRAISRPREQGHDVGHSVLASLLHFIDGASPPYQQQLKYLIKSQINQDTYRDFFTSINHVGNYQQAKTIMANQDVDDDDNVEGFFNYPSMDRVVFRREDWAFSLAMHSSRLGNFECMNNENRQGWFSGDGMNYLYNGQLDHYQNYWPAVNSYQLEGTTVDDQIMLECEGQRNQIKGGRKTQMEWVGAVKFDDIGMAGMDFTNWNDTLTAKKSWFMFDEQVVMLGSSIQSHLNAKITTAVANRKLPDDLSTKILVNGKRWQPQQSETLTLKSLSLLQKNIDDADISYVFLTPTKITLGQTLRHGDWQDIGTSSGAVSGEFLTAIIEHSPENNQYGYVLLPDADKDDVEEFVDEMPIKIVQNDQFAHIIKNKDTKITAANIWTSNPTKITAHITANAKMAIMIAKEKRQQVIVISDPLQTQSNVTLSFTKPVTIIDDKQSRIHQDNNGNVFINVDGLKGQSYRFVIKK